jgi:hypothetical protein
MKMRRTSREKMEMVLKMRMKTDESEKMRRWEDERKRGRSGAEVVGGRSGDISPGSHASVCWLLDQSERSEEAGDRGWDREGRKDGWTLLEGKERRKEALPDRWDARKERKREDDVLKERRKGRRREREREEKILEVQEKERYYSQKSLSWAERN